MYRHCISFESLDAYERFIQSMQFNAAWQGVDIDEGKWEGEGEERYFLISLKSDRSLPKAQERGVNRRDGVLATTFNIDLSPAKPGRPKTVQGDYEVISLKVRKDLLSKIDASGKSRREYIETLLEQ